ncbi:MAG: glycosyltransferase [Lachnospiraceae bacterium]
MLKKLKNEADTMTDKESNQVNGILNRAFDLEEQGDREKAIALLETEREEIEQNWELVLELGKMKFRGEKYREALLDFVECVNQGKSQEANHIIIECYYQPNEAQIQQTYRENKVLLSKYEYYYGDEIDRYDNDENQLIWQDDKMIVLWCSNNYIVISFEVNQKRGTDKNLEIFINKFDVEELLYVEQSTYEENLFKEPIYLYYEQAFFLLLLRMEGTEKLLESKRFVFIIGAKGIQNICEDDQLLLPQSVYTTENSMEYYKTLFSPYLEKKQWEYKKLETEVEEYYKNKKAHKAEDAYSILFWACRFTTATQYHVRDCMKAAQELGVRCKLLREKSDIHRITNISCYEALNEMKPDAIFMVDHVRTEFKLPKQLLCITWIQDPLETLMNPETPKQLGEKDIILSHFTTWKKFFKVGYQNYCTVLDAPIPANDKIYEQHQLSQEEIKWYQCDISFVCHAADDEKYLKNYIKQVDPQTQLLLKALFLNYKYMVYQNGIFFYSQEEFVQYIEKFLEELEAEGLLGTEAIKRVAGDMQLWYNQRVFRSVLVDWLLDAGYHNIKLWGNDWCEKEKYKEFAMGPAKNGETLSKIYQASKINIGNNILTTAAARVWECMLSGGFYLSNWIPEEADITDIRKIVKFGEEVDFFCNKKEFLDKIAYYLSHEEERKNMIEIGRKAALEKMTYKKLMEKVVTVLKEKC